MGSYSELHLHFAFRDDTPEAVLAAFAPMREVGIYQDEAEVPTLPAPEPEPWPEWEPEYRDALLLEPGDPDPDPVASEPWRHDWAPWLAGKLTWSSGHWHYQTSTDFKTDAETIHQFLTWLGPFIKPSNPDFPEFAGHIVPYYAPRPFLLMLVEDELELEDTNPPGSWFPE